MTTKRFTASLFRAKAAWNSLPGRLVSLGTVSPEPPLCKMTKAVAVVLRTHTTFWQHHFNSCFSSRIHLYWICPGRPSFTSIAHLEKSWFFLHFQQYSKQSFPRKLICKPQTSSQSLKSLKTGFLSLNTYCRSNGLHCKIYYQLNAQLWTEARVEYHDSNKK